MKISSVSKKVLASALSAAMVVAFAPTVAFGKAWTGTTPVTVHYDVNGGKIVDTSQTALPDGTATISGETLTLVNPVSSAAVTKDGMSFGGWFYDANGDGTFKTADGDVQVNTNVLNVADIAEASEITVKAIWNYEATLKLTPGAATINTAAATPESTMHVCILGSSGKYGASANSYKWQVTCPDGHVLDMVKGSDGTNSWADLDLTGHFASGKYVVTVKKADGVVVASMDYELVKVTLEAGAYGSFAAGAKTTHYVKKGTALSALNGLTSPVRAEGVAYTTNTFATSTGKVAGTASDAIDADTVLTAVWTNPKTTAAAYTAGATSLTFTNSNTLQALGSNAAQLKDYTVTVAGPNGFLKTWNFDGNGDKSSDGNFTVNFGKGSEGTANGTLSDAAYNTKDKLEAGTYTMTVVANKKADAPSSVEFQSIASGSITLAGVSIDLDGGSWKKDITSTDSTSGLKTDYEAVAKTLQQVDANFDATLKTNIATLMAGANIKAPAGKQFAGYSINGKKSTVTGDLAKVTTVTGTTEVKALYTDVAADAELSLASKTEKDGKYVLVFNAPAGVSVTYKIDNGAVTQLGSDKTITVKATDKLVVTGVQANHANKVLTYSDPSAFVTVFDNFAVPALNAVTSESTATNPVTYGSKLTTAKADGEAAIKALGYAEANEFDAAVLEQKKAVVKAIAGYANAQIEAAKALTKGANGKYTVISAAAAADAQAEIAKVVAAFDANNDTDVTNNVKVNGKTTGWNGDDYAKDITKAVKDAKAVTVEAAVAEPAIAVNEALAAAKTVAEAEAALTKFDALTAEQKQFVSSAAVAAAEEIVAAAEVKDAQDDAAVSKTRDASKTVKAGKNGKTTKKQSVTLKKITSKSGAKVTYKKSSGSSKVSVKSGKAYLAKGVKKGTYKATVKATCGTQTAKIKVTFKVK